MRAVLCFAMAGFGCSSLAAAPAVVPFPTEDKDIASHCMWVGAGANAVGAHFSTDEKAAPLTQAGKTLTEDVAASGALSRAELHKLNADQTLLQDHAMAFLRRTGMPTQAGQAPSQQALDEVASHLVRHRNR